MSYIHLLTQTNSTKPSTVHNQSAPCPFCSFAQLKKEGNVLASDKDLLWIKNKFSTLPQSVQTVIVETEDCHAGFSSYSLEKAQQVLSFSIDKWLEFCRKPEFSSALLFKNAGAFSGASIHHPHMQVIGLKEHQGHAGLSPSSFSGITLFEDHTCSISMSEKPKTEFYEFNLHLKILSLDTLSYAVCSLSHFILNELNPKFKSYNFAFYLIDGHIYMKIFSRYPTSVYLLGYNLQQLPDNIGSIAKKIQQTYFS